MGSVDKTGLYSGLQSQGHDVGRTHLFTYRPQVPIIQVWRSTTPRSGTASTKLVSFGQTDTGGATQSASAKSGTPHRAVAQTPRSGRPTTARTPSPMTTRSLRPNATFPQGQGESNGRSCRPNRSRPYRWHFGVYPAIASVPRRTHAQDAISRTSSDVRARSGVAPGRRGTVVA